MALHTRLGWIVLGLLWFWLFSHLHSEWSLNSRYNYGWAVPLLALVLLYLRWPGRPAATGAITRAGPLSGLLLAALLPIRIIEEANPDWRLLSWTLAIIVWAYSMVFLARIGGPKWVRHFLFPIGFPLVAVPWPVQFENAVVQAMTRAVAYFAVEIAGWLGIGAFQSGNIIQLRHGFVGVDEACSGVKTLQTGIMVALVLGELLRLGVGRRGALIVFGCGWIFVCNVFRATALVIVAATRGLDALEHWHDWIGMAALLAGLAGLLGLAWWWKTEPRTESHESRADPGGLPAAGQLIAIAWLVAVFGANEFWYRRHERQLIERPAWEVRWPEGNTTLRKLSIPENTRAILHYDEASSAAWEDPRGVRWWGFFARWKPSRAALQLVRSHSPEICLPAVGRTFRAEKPALTTQAGAAPLDFRTYEFEQEGRPLFVFVCIQEDKIVPGEAEEWNVRGRLLAAWRGKRNLGQRLLEIAVTGFADLAQAKEATAKTVAQIVETETPTR